MTSKRFLAELGVILLLGNLASLLSWLWNLPVNASPVNIALAVGIYLFVFWRYRPPLAPTKPNLRSLGLALGMGLLLSLPPLLFFKFPVLVSNLDYSPIKNLPASEVFYRVFISIPLFTALSEELLFRHYIYDQSKVTRLSAILGLNALIFTLWHLVVVMRTVLDTSLSQNFFLTGLSYLGALISVFVGGVAFAFVRQRTGNFYYSALTHWLNVAFMTLAIWLL